MDTDAIADDSAELVTKFRPSSRWNGGRFWVHFPHSVKPGASNIDEVLSPRPCQLAKFTGCWRRGPPLGTSSGGECSASGRSPPMLSLADGQRSQRIRRGRWRCTWR